MFEERVKFQEAKPREFFDRVLMEISCPNLKILSSKIKIPYSSLKKYCGGYLLLPKSLFEYLCHLAKVNPETFNFQIVDGNWGQVKGGYNAMEILMKKYKKEFPAWRKKATRNSSIKRTKKIKIPKMSEGLAEFIGIHLGDGTMTKHFIRISGDWRYDIPYFKYISDLIFSLFGIRPQIFKDPRPINTGLLLIRSKAVCSFLNKNYGIPFGNKILNGAQVPEEIMGNKKLSLACLRGLVDTDGSVTRRGSGGKQFCIDFRAHNKILLSQVKQITEKDRLFTHFYNRSSGTNCWPSILKYFKMVGSSNLRHIVRFHQRTLGNTLYQKEVVDYYGQDLYKQLSLPFKGLVI